MQLENSELNEKRNGTIDVIRILSCFMVVLIYISLPRAARDYSMVLACFGSPYFMMVTGWYVWREDSSKACIVAK